MAKKIMVVTINYTMQYSNSRTRKMKRNINWKWQVNKEHFDKNMSTN
jgi:hypothetical protein